MVNVMTYVLYYFWFHTLNISIVSYLEKPEVGTNKKNYEQVENEQSTYTALKNPGERDDDDDHVYSHLNEVDNDYVNQKETGI